MSPQQLYGEDSAGELPELSLAAFHSFTSSNQKLKLHAENAPETSLESRAESMMCAADSNADLLPVISNTTGLPVAEAQTCGYLS